MLDSTARATVIARSLWLDYGRWLYGISYGAVVATGYILFRVYGGKVSLLLFGVSCVVAFGLHAIVRPKQAFLGLLKPTILLRGFLFGATQVLILKGQAQSGTSFAFMAATVGNLLGVVIAGFVLREGLSRAVLLALGLSGLGCLINPQFVILGWLPLLAGLLQAVSAVALRRVVLEARGSFETISTGFGIAGFISILTELPTSSADIFTFAPTTVIGFVLLSLVIQYSYFYLVRIFSAQQASLLSMLRIPWGMTIEGSAFSVPFGVNSIASGVLISCGGILGFAVRHRIGPDPSLRTLQGSDSAKPAGTN